MKILRVPRAFLGLFAVTLVIASGVVTARPARAALSPHIQVNRTFVGPGDGMTVTGFSFAANDDVVISGDLTVANKLRHIETSATADQNGSFQASMGVPGGTNQGTYLIVARDFHGHQATWTIHVLPLAFVAAAQNSGTTWVIPSSSFYVSGKGFTANEQITLKASFPQYNGSTIDITRTRQVSATGTYYEVVMPVPGDSKAGDTTLTITGQSAQEAAKTTLHVFYRPSIKLQASAYRPGTVARVSGQGYVPNSTIQVSVPIALTDGTTLTVSRTAHADGHGFFTAYVPLPSGARLGKYTINARDVARGFHATTSLLVSEKPTIAVTPPTLYPGESFTAAGSNFGTGVTVHVSAKFNLSSGSSTVVEGSQTSGSAGNYSVTLVSPTDASAGSVTVTAASANASVSASVQVQQPPTPLPTATPNPSSTSVPKKHHHTALGYSYISVWYHVMREGTREHVIVQSTLHVKQGIWVHVWFPGQNHYAFYNDTSSKGVWDKWFLVPKGSATSGNATALITFRLWHGNDNVKEFQRFRIIH
jgi:hypothetical protein